MSKLHFHVTSCGPVFSSVHLRNRGEYNRDVFWHIQIKVKLLWDIKRFFVSDKRSGRS